MLSHAKLPKSFWVEAIKTIVVIINLTPSVPLEGDVPEEVWSNNRVSYNHLKVFGCRAFVHIPKDERAKLDSKIKELFILGHQEMSSAIGYGIQLIGKLFRAEMLFSSKIKQSQI